MGSDPTLQYPNKEFEWSVLQATSPADLVEQSPESADRILKSGEVWQNLLIFADNLPALKALTARSDVRGQVRLVYIDPPFSANQNWRAGGDRVSTISYSDSDRVAYQDKLEGVEFLEFLRKRLIFLRELMAEDGSIYVHIDWKMGHYVKVLLDEVFGIERFVNDIARVKCNPKNFERKGYGNIRDMILFYSKSAKFLWNGAVEPYTDKEIERLFPKVDKDGRRYTTNPLHAPGETRNGVTGHLWNGLSPPKGRHWRYAPEELTRLDIAGLIEWSSTGNPRKKIFAHEFARKQKKAQDVWTFKDPAYPAYPTEKNLEMLVRIIGASSKPGDLVMDCFAGSGTTLLAAEALGRRWIGVDNSPVALSVMTRRLKELQVARPFAVLSERPVAEKG